MGRVLFAMLLSCFASQSSAYPFPMPMACVQNDWDGHLCLEVKAVQTLKPFAENPLNANISKHLYGLSPVKLCETNPGTKCDEERFLGPWRWFDDDNRLLFWKPRH